MLRCLECADLFAYSFTWWLRERMRDEGWLVRSSWFKMGRRTYITHVNQHHTSKTFFNVFVAEGTRICGTAVSVARVRGGGNIV